MTRIKDIEREVEGYAKEARPGLSRALDIELLLARIEQLEAEAAKRERLINSQETILRARLRNWHDAVVRINQLENGLKRLLAEGGH